MTEERAVIAYSWPDFTESAAVHEESAGTRPG
jgi:hypothetical protein